MERIHSKTNPKRAYADTTGYIYVLLKDKETLKDVKLEYANNNSFMSTEYTSFEEVSEVKIEKWDEVPEIIKGRIVKIGYTFPYTG